MAQNSNPGNFANDKEKASEAGHKGGQHSTGSTATGHEKTAASQKSGEHGSEHRGGNFAEDREKASAAGKKGGSR